MDTEIKPQMLVVFKNGNRVLFNLDGYFEFEDVFYQLRKWFCGWIQLGTNGIARKKDVVNVFYFPEGYSKSKESTV